MKIDESSGIRCILLWLPDIIAQPAFEYPFDPSVKNLLIILITIKSSFNMCGFDSDFLQSVNRKVYQAVSHTKLEYLV